MNVVYHANYFVYFEMARGELLRESGMPCGELEEKGIFLPVIECGCTYRKPARYDELISVRSTCSSIRGTRFRIDCRVSRGEELLAEGFTVHVSMNRQGKATRLPPELLKLTEENHEG
jgi:acyl-CoA thioester hydrolase